MTIKIELKKVSFYNNNILLYYFMGMKCITVTDKVMS